jgi:ribosomal protein L18
MDKVDRIAGIGELICKKANELNIKKAYFNRNGFKYHGSVKKICEVCRKLALIN